jgi:hypothetical protein
METNMFGQNLCIERATRKFCGDAFRGHRPSNDWNPRQVSERQQLIDPHGDAEHLKQFQTAHRRPVAATPRAPTRRTKAKQIFRPRFCGHRAAICDGSKHSVEVFESAGKKSQAWKISSIFQEVVRMP